MIERMAKTVKAELRIGDGIEERSEGKYELNGD